MLCERCQSRPASVRVQRTQGNQVEKKNLCYACAEEIGVNTGTSNRQTPFSSFPGFGGDPFFDSFFGRGQHEHEGIPVSPDNTGRHSPQQPPSESVNILDTFSERAKGVIQKAAETVIENKSAALDTEHLLIGVAKELEIGQQVLKNLDIDPEELIGYLTENMGKDQKEYGEDASPELAPRAKNALELSWHAARNLQHDYVGSEHILLGLLAEDEGLAAQTLKKYGLTETKLRQTILTAVGEKGKKTGQAKKKSKTPTLDKYSRDLTALAEENKLDPVIGRGEEVQRVVQILSRRTKNNPVLIGEPGTGKTAIIEGLAARITNKNVPEVLLEKRVVALDIASLLAGTKHRGEFEERMKKVIDEVTNAKGGIIMFLDELHTLVGAGGTGESGTMDAANMLKPSLARGDLQVVGATTLNEYKKYIEKDGALERRFQTVIINEPTIEDTIAILRGLKDRYEAHHKVMISDSAIQAAVHLSSKYVRDRFLPDKAIDLMDEAAAKVRLQSLEKPAEVAKKAEEIKNMKKELSASKRAKNKERIKQLEEKIKKAEEKLNQLEESWHQNQAKSTPEVQSSDIEPIVSSWTGIPVEKITEAEAHKLLNLETELHKRVVAQEQAVNAVSEAIRRTRAGLKDPNRPQGSFLFLGPTGVGKTELTKALAEILFGSQDNLVRLDMSEYMEKHAVSRMIGSPPGYVGHEEGGQLTEIVRRKPYSVILLDEIEKAHPDVFNILLQVLEDGQLTDGKGRVVDFKNTLIIMTSNIGSDMIQQATARGSTLTPENRKKEWNDLKELLDNKLKETFRPEFLNRLDDVIIFHALTKKHVQKITDYLLEELKHKVGEQGLSLQIDNEVRNRLAQDGFDPKFGARPLRRQIQQRLENKLATALLTGQFPQGSTIKASLQDDEIALSKINTSGKSKKSVNA